MNFMLDGWSHQDLLWELAGIVAATLFLCTGLASITLGTLRSRDRTLLWFGALTLLYGVRLTVSNRLTSLAMEFSVVSQRHIILVIAAIIQIPAVLFFREILSQRWRRTATVWAGVEIAFMPIGIAFGFSRYQQVFWTTSNVLAILSALLLMTVVFWPGLSGLDNVSLDKTSRRVMSATLVIFTAFVIARNLNWLPQGHDLEPIGFGILVAGLGYAAARVSTQRENKLRDVEYELETARRIQRSILPRHLPSVPGLELVARYEPMTAVAGDFYDFLPVPGRRAVTILVADVSGHGVPAALIASMLKVAFTAQAEYADDPARILANLNATLAGQLDGQFVTAACAFVDLDAGQVVYAGAGHPPALLVGGDGSIFELKENGLMLGPFRQAAYRNVSANFARGDKLVLYTDGIIEATLGDGEQFGLDRLKTFARGPRKFSDFADHLIAAVAGPVREDDLTVVVAEVHH